MTPLDGRRFWKALMENAAMLVADAHVLLKTGSAGRARSLLVLAQEELGKALWLYEAFADAWNSGDLAPRTVDQLLVDGRSHTRKFLEATVFGDNLRGFWGHYGVTEEPLEGESWDSMFTRRRAEAESAARSANVQKQRGFYADRDDSGTIHSPSEVALDGISEDLQKTAQIIEMLLITDHSRMKFDAATDYDSTHEQQAKLMPMAHPELSATQPDHATHAPE